LLCTHACACRAHAHDKMGVLVHTTPSACLPGVPWTRRMTCCTRSGCDWAPTCAPLLPIPSSLPAVGENLSCSVVLHRRRGQQPQTRSDTAATRWLGHNIGCRGKRAARACTARMRGASAAATVSGSSASALKKRRAAGDAPSSSSPVSTRPGLRLCTPMDVRPAPARWPDPAPGYYTLVNPIHSPN